MRKNIMGVILLFVSVVAYAVQWQPAEWPVLKHYDQQHLYRVALPLGGIGTGTVSLGGRGELCDWEIMNVPAKHYSTVTPGNNAPFFVVYTKEPDKKALTTLLSGPLYDQEYLHYEGRPVDHHGFPRFASASFDAAYPFGQVHLSDPDLPVKVTVKGFNPLIPGDAERSGLPIAVLSYEVTNLTNTPLEVAVCGAIRNFIGKDGSKFTSNWKGDYVPLGAKKNRNQYKKTDGLEGIYFYSEGVDAADPAYGTMALTAQTADGISYRTASVADDWNNAILDFWDDFSADGRLTEAGKAVDDDPMASLAVKKTLAPNETRAFSFFLTWSFPNRKAWSGSVVGNYYTTRYPNAWDAARQIIPELPELEKETLLFVENFLKSTYPDVIKEAALFNLATLRSQTVFRLPSGHLMGWEGVMDRYGSCMGSCTHVWNYEQATAFLFGDLSRTMRDVEFNYATREDGLMNFRAALPLSEAAKGGAAAADGQMGCIMKFYRDWQLSGDFSFLSANWPQVKQVLSYAWTERGWDGNEDGVMEGSQHNTMDVNYFGPNPQMGFWYLGALRAAEEMAKAMGDRKFEKKCRRLFLSGSAWMDTHLFNGAYYEQQITDPETFEFLDMEREQHKIPPYQLGKGCLVDQLVGQYMAHICGLGYLGRPEHIRTTMESVMKYNFVPDFSRHFNNMRSYVLGDEAGLLMASWPKGRLKIPFPYFAEVMTGFEYCAAVEMLYEGLEDEALTCIKAIRDRHDGAKRNPFSEAECGHHYARSMASWASVLAWSNFHYSAVSETFEITGKPGNYFWSNGYAWGMCQVDEDSVRIQVLKGQLKLKQILVGGRKVKVGRKIVLEAGSSKTFA